MKHWYRAPAVTPKRSARAAIVLLLATLAMPPVAQATVPGGIVSQTVVPQMLGRVLSVTSTGTAFFTGTRSDGQFGLATVDASGSLEGAYTRDEFGYPYSIAVATDADDNCLVLAESDSNGAVLMKFSNARELLWTCSFKGYMTDACVATDGSIYVVGERRYESTGYDAQIYKVTSAGKIKWSRHRAHAKGRASDWAKSVTTDARGNVIIAGGTNGGTSRGTDMLVAKYRAGGDAVWSRSYHRKRSSRLADNWDIVEKIVVDKNGSPVAVGWSRLAGEDWDYLTVKFSTGGALKWSRVYAGPVKGKRDLSTLGCVDSRGNVYIAGESTSKKSGADYAVVSYSSGGSRRWVRRYDGTKHHDDLPLGMVADPSGRIYVTGKSEMGLDDSDAVTVCWDSSGVRRWTSRFSGGPYQDCGWGLALTADRLLVGGALATGPGFSFDGFLLGYAL